MKEQLQHYWQSRSPRDRRTIALIGSLIGITLLYAYIWMPMNEARVRLRAELPKLRGAAEQMSVQAQEVTRLKATPAQATRTPPQELINQSAETSGIKGDISQITQLSPDRVQVILNNVSFDAWMRWTHSLAQQSGLRIDSARVTANNEPGMVKVQAVLVLPGR